MVIPQTQDLPPQGGYKKITFAKIPPKTYFNGPGLIACYLGITAGAAYLFYLNDKMIRKTEIEQRSACLALYPLLVAERDREFLKQLRRNRDEEADLMKNVEGWKVGTWYGEKVYNTLPEDTLVEPRIYEYYAQTSYSNFAKRAMLMLWG